ncbi:MAG: dienelactone hydrolase [Phycisphaerales bacterium]|jgi:dienelactone hydrolase
MKCSSLTRVLAAALATGLGLSPACLAQATEPPVVPEPSATAASEVSYPSTDETTIYADLYLPVTDTTTPKALILAFHMAGSDARGEYSPYTAPRLAENGFAVLTPDTRLGGERMGTNRTVAALKDAGVPELGSFCDAYPDLVATLDFAEAWLAEHYPTATGEEAIPIVALGSSYTATLVLRLAAEEGGRLAGVLSFSPAAGNPMEGCQPEAFYEDLDLPRIILIPERETNNETKRRFLTNSRVLGFIIHIEPGGLHGSLLLDPEKNTDDDSQGAWDKVLGFLDRVTE